MFEPNKWTIFAAAIVGAAGADGAIRRGDFGQIGYRDYTPGGCHARSSDPAPSHHAVCRGVLVLIPDQPSRLLGLEFILTAGTFGVALLWGGGLYRLVTTVILSVLGGVFSAWLFLVEQV